MFTGIATPRIAAENPGHESDREPIAIIGIGCRFPGANGPEEFWQMLRDGVDAITDIPSDRFDVDSVYDPRPGTPGKIINRAGGFLKKIDEFDASFFGISPREASRLDPQQRLLLEVTWEALEDAGIPPRQLAGSDTGVFIGACTADYEDIQYHLRHRSELDFYVATGTARSVLSGRISYVLDLSGPSLTVDTACSSSLVAVHLACQSLWNGESNLAIAGGVNLVLLPELSMPFSRANMLAADSRCRFADAGASGFTRSDGVGVVLLKSLSKAQADQDPIYATILSTAINNDGRSSGLLATPSREGQQAVLREAYRKAGISPGTVQYVELHGTGTSVGDPVEIESLGAVLAEGRPVNSPCIIGSVKTNIGHTEGAAGVAGLIKAALCLKRKAIPPSLHFNDPNPAISWHQLPLEVSRKLTPWPTRSGPAFAGVSAFGISATNAHVVLQEATELSACYREDSHPDRRAQLLTLSAHTSRALEETAEAYIAFSKGTLAKLQDICYSASVRRTHHDYRLAVVAHSRAELDDHLQAFLDRQIRPSITSGLKSSANERKLVFVFPGQGSQWLGMGRQLMQQEQVFRSALTRCDDAFRRHVDWSLIEELTAEPSRSRLSQIDVVQPCIFAIQVALAQLWRHWGIEPDAVVGQSMGEIAAAHVAGALSIEDAAQIICRRSLLLRRVTGRGGMAVVGFSFEETQKALAGYEGDLSIAVSSSPFSTVIAGDTEALLEVMEALQSRSVFCQSVKVDVASHSPQMDVLREELLDALEGIAPQPASVPVYSTVTGESARDLVFDAKYWAANLRQPVLFSRTIQSLIESGHDIFLELSPHPILLNPIQQTSQRLGREASLLPSMRHDEDERAVLLGSVGALYAAGYRIDWRRFYPEGSSFIKPPSYRWQRQHFWLGPDQSGNDRSNTAKAPNHLLSVSPLQSAADAGTYIWEFDLSSEMFPFLEDHRVQDMAVLPAAAYLEMAITAGQSLFVDQDLILERVEFKKALMLSDDARRVQLVVSSQSSRSATFEFFCLESGEGERSWTLHATGAIRIAQAEPAPMDLSYEAIMYRCNYLISQDLHYKSLAELGLQYGPCFQGVRELWMGDKQALATVVVPEPLAEKASNYHIHPALLDSYFQVLAATLPVDQTDTYLPVGLERLKIYRRPGQSVWAHAVLRECIGERAEVLKGDLVAFEEDGQVLLEVTGVRMKRLSQQKQATREKYSIEELLYKIDWRSSDGSQQSLATEKQPGAWIVFADKGGTGQALVDRLESSGEHCVKVFAGERYAEVEPGHYQINADSFQDYLQLLSDAFKSQRRKFRGVVHLWSLDAHETRELSNDLAGLSHAFGWNSTLFLVKALEEVGKPYAPRLWLVTGGAQMVIGEEILSIAQSPIWGLGKVIANEHPQLRCSLVDLDTGSEEETILLWQELSADGDEDQIALRGDTRYVARLVRHATPESMISEKECAPEDQAFRLEITTPGLLDSLTLRETTREKPGYGKIEIQVHAVGLNFRDVMLAMDVLPSAPEVKEDYGWECAGTVVEVGEGVDEFAVGDEVYAIAHPCFGAYATTHASLALHKPAHLSFEEAATLPLAYLTAHYSLNHLGRLKDGERVLVHSASGGVGLAAVRIAQQQGAEVFATAGNPQKQEFLRSLGIRHVFDSRSLDFVDEIMRVTGDEGVDIVLNSLAGEAISAGLSILRPGGRFLELGRRDIYQNAKLGLGPFHNNLAFYAIDLGCLIPQKPAYMGSLLREAMVRFAKGGGSPLPLQSFSMANVEDGFRSMAHAKHIGKIALRVHGERVKVAPSDQGEFKLSSDGTYLITGGLGGLGLSIARWMIERGAQHLALIARSEGTRSAQKAVEAMRESADIRIFNADVSDYKELSRVLAEIKDCMPLLRGVVHAAGLLDDGILLQQDQSRFNDVMAPKIAGAWNLHTLTLESPLDFFVLFSSAATLLGSAGQGNYSAANAFLDCLAHYRRSQGIPGLSINWGPWAEVGLAAEGNRGERLAQKGVDSITPLEGVTAFERLLRASSAQVAVMAFDLEEWSQHSQAVARSPLFAEMLQGLHTKRVQPAKKEFTLTRDALCNADHSAREKLLQCYLNALLAGVLGFDKSSVDRLDVNQPINRFGVDSLMALEMNSRIAADLGVVIPIVNFLKGSSIAKLAAYTLDQLPIPVPQAKDLMAKAAVAATEQWEEINI